jgi:hypothetical protein
LSELPDRDEPADGYELGDRPPVVELPSDGCVEPDEGRALSTVDAALRSRVVACERSPVEGRERSPVDGMSVFDQPPESLRSQLPLSLRRYTLPLLSV